MKMLQLLLLVTAALSPSVAKVFHVTPVLPATEYCPPPCHTLDQYAQNVSLLTGHTNITLVFLAGAHNLSYDWNFSGNGQNIILQRQNLTSSQAVEINYVTQTVSNFTNLANFEMYDLELSGGHRMFLGNINNIDFSHVHFSIIDLLVTSDNASQITINDCNFKNGGILLLSADTVINNTIFTALSPFNVSMQTLEMQNCSVISSDLNAHCSYSQCNVTVSNTMFTGNSFSGLTITADNNVTQGTITIEECDFVDNYGYGVYVYSEQVYKRILMDMSIKRSKFYNNTSFGVIASNLIQDLSIGENSMFLGDGPAVIVSFIRGMSIENCLLNSTDSHITAYETDSLHIMNSIFTNGLIEMNVSVQSLRIQGCKFNGGDFGLYLYEIQRVMIQNSSITHYRAFGMIVNAAIEAVIAEGSHISHNFVGVASNLGLTVHNTVFTDNHIGIAVIALGMAPQIPEQNLTTKFYNSSFNKNNEALLLLNLLQHSAIIEDCRFEYNTGTPISAYQSKFELRGETVFKENTATRGGGLALYSSTVLFGSDSHTMFINNTATEFGGAIYIGQMTSFPPNFLIAADRVIHYYSSTYGPVIQFDTNNLLHQSCFYQSVDTHQVIFNNNTAIRGGFDIFGPTLYNHNCSVNKNQIFEYTTSDPSFQISSNPTRVCFCTDNVPQCMNKSQLFREETRYPGESFTVSVALAGYSFGRVAGSVYTNVLGRGYNDVIGENRHVQTAALTNCSELEYTISFNSSVILVLTAQDQRFVQGNIDNIETNKQDLQLSSCNDDDIPCIASLTTPIYINVTLDNCPLGFLLNDDNVCDCDHTVNNINFQSITCELHNHTGYINREGTVWIGVDTSQNNTDVYYWQRNCPPYYCNLSRIPVDLRSPDSQCNSNRAGVLCGRCTAGHTLQLGGNKCVPLCNNNYLLLLVVFTALGILLVAFIKILDLTVASGTINGLILYANIVWRYNTILFPQQTIGYYVITLPIAWINLDFGIETCFSKHLDQVTKTGLQFVFPVYIWCIAGLIIFISHYSKRATKLFGNNSVGVLATLFLLSYGKISQNIIDVLTPAHITDSNNIQHKVWALDGTIEFGQTPSHVILILIALVFLFIFWLPFTLSLLLVPFLRAKSHLRPFHWINKLKPFFDTFYGPYKDKNQHQVWIGILLISRMVILIVYVITFTWTPNANILLMTLIAIILLVYTAIVSFHYKKWYVSALQVLYILNLMILGIAFLFYQTLTPIPEYRINPVAATSVLIALVQFVCILVFHAIRQVNVIKNIPNYFKKKETREIEMEIKLDNNKEVHDPTYQLVVVEENFALIESNNYDPTVLREALLEN